MKLTIIVCYYRGHRHIEKCLRSLVPQLIEGTVECLVIENGVDVDANVKNKFPAVNYIGIETNSGLGPARNLGLQLAKGEFVWYIDDDAWVPNGTIKYLLESVLVADCIYGGGLVLNANNQYTLSKVYHDFYYSPLQKALKLIIGTNMYFRTSALKTVEGFHPDLNRADEAYVVRKLSAKGFKGNFISNVEVFHNQPSDFKNILRVFIDNGRYRCKMSQGIFAKFIRTGLHSVTFVFPVVAIFSLPLALLLVFIRFIYSKTHLILIKNRLYYWPIIILLNTWRIVLEDYGYTKEFVGKFF